MEEKKLRVVVIGTGNVAGIAIRCLQGRKDMELVGVWGHKETAPQHIGMDSGLLDLDTPNGIIITGDEEWYKKFLSRGINVVSPSVPDLAQKRIRPGICG